MSGDGKCQRGGCQERDNYRGYCSIYCQDMHEVELERDEALADVKALNRALDRAANWIHHLREGIEAYRNNYGCHDMANCGEAHKFFEHRDGFSHTRRCTSCEWEREYKRWEESGDER